MRTIVYVDAFNLYFGAVKGTPYKWLDLHALAVALLKPENNITGIRYFTAKVSARPDDPGQPTRQQLYLRALRTIPNIQIVYGHYLTHVVWMPLAHTIPGQKPFVQVIKTEEKGSDVNLASYMLVDAAANTFDCAVIVSGDSDLKMPVQLVQDRFNKIVGVLNPQKHPCKALQGTALFYKHIRESALAACQFPPVLVDAKGTFHKPPSW
ncbi:MAG TPA: NYN domain protein [Verrucomicrobia bacterium]|jgi:uncharacterized LabA/DUF88 family protein|nr:NYN domain protein [Verrucomicrobiota bacterium]